MTTTPDASAGQTLQSIGFARDGEILDAVLAASQGLVVILDAEGHILRFNTSCEAVTGYTADDVSGRRITDVLIADDEREAVSAVLETLCRGENQSTYENDWLTRTGERVRIAWQNRVVFTANGEVGCVVAAGLDLSWRNALTAALRGSEVMLELEQARYVAEARLAGIVSIAADAILTIDEEQRITFFNEGAERIFGYARSEVLDQPLEILIPARFHEVHREHVNRFGASADSARRMGERREILGVRRSGEEFPAEASIAKLDVNGVRAHLVVLQDVSERRRAERVLRASETRFREALDHAPIGTALADPDGRWVYANRALCDMLGCTEAVLLAASPREIMHSDDLDLGIDQRTALLQGWITSYRIEPRYLHSDGHVVWTQVTVSLVHDAEWRPLHIVQQIEDISNRKLVEVERERLLVREAEGRRSAERAERRALFMARASAMLDASLDFEATIGALTELIVPALATFVIVDIVEEDGTVRRLQARHANPLRRALADRFERLPLGRSAPYLTRRAVEQGVPELVTSVTDADLQAVASDSEHLALLRGLEARSYLVVPLSARGRTLGALALVADRTMEPYEGADLAFAEEIGYRAALAIDNARQYARAQRASALRDEVLGVVSHDLRNPLAAISMYAAVLADAPRPEPEQISMAVAGIRESADWMQHLIGDLLDVTNIEAGRLAVEREGEDPFVLVIRVLEMFRGAAEARGLSLVVDLPERLPTVLADGFRIVQALANLVANAVKFTEPGGRITLSGRADERAVHLSVADTGPGIAPEHVPHIFDRFWHAGKTARVRGSGLGLAIVQGIVEAHGGRAEVSSEIGRGTRFTVTLPRASEGGQPAES